MRLLIPRTWSYYLISDNVKNYSPRKHNGQGVISPMKGTTAFDKKGGFPQCRKPPLKLNYLRTLYPPYVGRYKSPRMNTMALATMTTMVYPTISLAFSLVMPRRASAQKGWSMFVHSSP